MRRYHWVRLYALLLMVVLFALAALAGVKGAFHIYRESGRQRGIVKSVELMKEASSSIIDHVSVIAQRAGQEQYEQLMELLQAEDGASLSEKALEGYFRAGYAGKIRQAIGADSSVICASLDSYIREDGISNITVLDDPGTGIIVESDSDGHPTSIRIKNVILCYEDLFSGSRTDTLNYNIQFPDTVFHAGNDDLFSYCMVARKGIYMTGPTSSVIGNIFAGKHSAEECREAEVAYGETATYGGLNILSTQIGIRADRVISEGDININGSFALFVSNDGAIDCFAQNINRVEGFSKDSRYTLEGNFYDTNLINEGSLNEYREAVNLINSSLAHLDPASIYYDSKNDRNYEGRYRKLISGSDVEIRDDFTGIVATRANVIIHRDVNFEGLILCGDRIYTMGNNNIVANPAVASDIIASEYGGEYVFRIRDYIGGMKNSGLTDPEYYVIPYR